MLTKTTLSLACATQGGLRLAFQRAILIQTVLCGTCFSHHDDYAVELGGIALVATETAADGARIDGHRASGVSELARQRAFFEYQMLTHLARHAPAPSQQAAIKLGFMDHQLVNPEHGRPTFDELQQSRRKVYVKLKQDYVIIPIVWSNDGAQFELENPIDLTAGLSRHVLLDVENQTSEAVDISARQLRDHEVDAPMYTIHPDHAALVPIELFSESVDETELRIAIDGQGRPDDEVEIDVPVRVQMAATIRGTLFDSERQQRWPGRVYVLGSDRIYRHGKAYAGNETLSTKQLLQFWNLGKYYKLPFFYSDGSFEVRVPAGTTEITLERGFEHEVVSTVVDLQPGDVHTVKLSSSRIRDMRQLGWVSGDTHVHWVTNQWNVDLPLNLLAMVQRAEDLRVANNLTLLQRGPSLAFINPAQAPMGTVEKYSNDQYHVEMGEEYRNEDLYGHLCFLNLKWLVQPIGTGSIIAGPDALDYPINKTAILACRAQGGISCEAHGLGGNKDVPVNVVHGLTDSLDQIHPHEYYEFLDCGFQLPLTNGSDHPARVVGCARAYVKVDGSFTYGKWIDGIRHCRTFTTSGPLLFLNVNESGIGDTIEAKADESLHIRAEAISRYPIGTLQIVSNGDVLKETRVDDTEAVLELTIPASESRWFVARCSQSDNYNAIEANNVAHTSAIYVDVDRASRFVPDTARRWVGRMRQHIRDIQTKGQFADEAQMQEAIDYVEAGIAKYEAMIETFESNRGALRRSE